MRQRLVGVRAVVASGQRVTQAPPRRLSKRQYVPERDLDHAGGRLEAEEFSLVERARELADGEYPDHRFSKRQRKTAHGLYSHPIPVTGFGRETLVRPFGLGDERSRHVSGLPRRTGEQTPWVALSVGDPERSVARQRRQPTPQHVLQGSEALRGADGMAERHDRLQVKHALSLMLGFDCVPCVLTGLRPSAVLIRGDQAAQDDKSQNEIDERQTFYLRHVIQDHAQRLIEEDYRGYGEAGRQE